MYIMCIILCLFSALNCGIDALQIAVIIIIVIVIVILIITVSN